jgi:hypothetical protein
VSASTRPSTTARTIATQADKAAALLSIVLRKYAPLPSPSLGHLVYLLGGGAPQLARELKHALAAQRSSAVHAKIDGTTWYWPETDNPRSARHAPDQRVRLLAPFDPVVWDPAALRAAVGLDLIASKPTRQRRSGKLGYYACRCCGTTVSSAGPTSAGVPARWTPQFGYVAGVAPRSRAFRAELDDEISRLRTFLRL